MSRTEPPRPALRARAYLVHLYTASGAVLAFLAAAELTAPAPDARAVLLLLAAAVLVDATDGPLARRLAVKLHAPHIEGRTIDDIVDYLTYTFLPLLLVWRMGWLPEPAALWVVPPLVASLFGFANTEAKDEDAGYFLGFPSYWNVVAFYAGILHRYSPWINVALLLLLALLTLAPLRFLYPNLAPRRWRRFVVAGALLWLLSMIAMLPAYPDVPAWAVVLSLLYPVAYTLLSLRLHPPAVRPRAKRMPITP
jgi:phosphatidylcholine synthase